MRPLLGTFVEIGVADAGGLHDQAVIAAINIAFERIELLHHLLSFHSQESDLSLLNHNPCTWVDLHPLSIQCLRLACALMRSSKLSFNCTVGRAVVEQGALPASHYFLQQREQLLMIGDAQDIQLRAHQARLGRPLLITLDGIAKGFAVDKAIQCLQTAGVKSAWVNAGGDMRVYGNTVMPIAVRDHTGQEHSVGGLQNAAIATSTSIYDQDHPGLLLGVNGAKNRAATWTIVARQAWRADALTKVAANVPLAQRAAVIEKLGGRWVEINP